MKQIELIKIVLDDYKEILNNIQKISSDEIVKYLRHKRADLGVCWYIEMNYDSRSIHFSDYWISRNYPKSKDLLYWTTTPNKIILSKHNNRNLLQNVSSCFIKRIEILEKEYKIHKRLGPLAKYNWIVRIFFKD